MCVGGRGQRTEKERKREGERAVGDDEEKESGKEEIESE